MNTKSAFRKNANNFLTHTSNDTGITLIALVVTIIILIILATISINIIVGENGLIAQAERAKGVYENSADREQGIMDQYANIIANGGKTPETPVGDKPGKPDENGFFTENGTIDGKKASENNPTIPKGFKPIPTETSSWTGKEKTAPTEQDVKNGLVIQDNLGNEFVWIPVPNISLMANKITDKEGQTDSNGNEYYQGKLYDFNSGTGITEMTKYGHGTENYREPAYLSGATSDDNTSYGKLFTETSLQEDYNSMIVSVKKYKGFYVGRYEMSEGFASKKKEKSADSSVNRWYGLYRKANSFYSKDDNDITVVGSMIWGSQYDRMMIWMTDNGINVRSGTPISGATRNTGIETGKEENDKLNNIYDLLGCRRDWTLEAWSSDTRVFRGGGKGSDQELWPGIRVFAGPANNYDYYGTRLTLYIK